MSSRYQQSGRAMLAGAAAILCLLIPVAATAQTRLFNNQAFLQAPNAEVGVRPNGAFGSTSVPAGYHSNTGACLGFIVSRNSNGWGAGAQIDGDFFCPGNPTEIWSLTVNGATAFNTENATGIPGTLGGLVVGPPTHSVTWTSNAPFNGVAISQTYSLSHTDQTLRMSVTVTNTTGAAINGVQFARVVDPDNATSPGQFTSTDLVVSQAPAQVTASFTTGALIALSSSHPRATAGYQLTRGGSPFTAAAIIAENGWETTPGSTHTADSYIGLAVDIGTLAAGASETFTLSYPLTEQAAEEEAAPAVVPTMTEWAMILLGLMLAGGAALTIQGRRASV